jgi:hypothetical protein
MSEQHSQSLDAAPFTAAMQVQEPMTDRRRALVGARLLALAEADRHELMDFWLGDREIYWCTGGTSHEDADEWLAIGYDNSTDVSVTLLDPSGEPFAEWEGDDARPLLSLGRPAGSLRHQVTAELARRDGSSHGRGQSSEPSTRIRRRLAA